MCAVSVGLTAPAAVSAGEGFSLTSAVPDDVFVCVAGQHNPERQFLDDYWSTVIEVLRQSGIEADLMDLIGSFGGQEQQAEAQKYKDLAAELVKGVDWGQLVGREMTFAMRMPRLVQTGDDFNVGSPEYLVMLLGSPGSGAKNFEGLIKIVDTILARITEAAEVELALTKAEQNGARVASLPLIPPRGEGREAYGLGIAQRQDVIVFAVGDRILGQALDLLAGTGSAKPLSASPRFQQAFAKLPSAEDGMTFFDMQRMLTDIRAITDPIFKATELPKDQFLSTGRSAQANYLIGRAMESYGKGDYEMALKRAKAAHKHDATDTVVMFDLACFNAKLGKNEKALSWLERAVDGGFYAPNKITADSDLDSLRDDPRYKVIFDKAVALAGGSPEMSEVPDAQRRKIAWARQLTDMILGPLGMMDYWASVEHTDGYITRVESVCVLTAEASKQPFYPVLGQREPLTEFAKYLPVETISFSVSGGLDLNELYTFLETSAGKLGPAGEQALAKWAEIQQQIGFDLRKDLLSWWQGAMISVTVRLAGGDAWVAMVKVTDEAAAREKVMGTLDTLAAKMQEFITTNPQLAMVTMQLAPATHEKLAGFKQIMFPMGSLVLGVADGYVILGSSEEAVALCLATGAGEHPNVTTNERVMSEALVPKGAFRGVSFKDLRQRGAKIAGALQLIQMVAGMAAMAIPPDLQAPVTKLLGILAKLAPAAKKIDFYKSSASYATFDGQVWHTYQATNYASPAERTTPSEGAEAAKGN